MQRGNDKYTEGEITNFIRSGNLDKARGAWVLFREDPNFSKDLAKTLAVLPKQDVDRVISLLEITLKSPTHTNAIGVKLREFITSGDAQKLIGFLEPIEKEFGNALRKRDGMIKYYIDDFTGAVNRSQRSHENRVGAAKDSLMTMYIPLIAAYTTFMTGNAHNLDKYDIKKDDFVNIHQDSLQFAKYLSHVANVVQLTADKIKASNPELDIKRFVNTILRGIEIKAGDDNTVRFNTAAVVEKLRQINSNNPQLSNDINNLITLIERETARLNQHQEATSRTELSAASAAAPRTSAGILLALAAANPDNVDPTAQVVQGLQDRQTNLATESIAIETPATSQNIGTTVSDSHKAEKVEQEEGNDLEEVKQHRM